MKSLLQIWNQVSYDKVNFWLVLQQQFEDKQSPMGGTGGYQVDGDSTQFSNLINELMRMNYH